MADCRSIRGVRSARSQRLTCANSSPSPLKTRSRPLLARSSKETTQRSGRSGKELRRWHRKKKQSRHAKKHCKALLRKQQSVLPTARLSIQASRSNPNVGVSRCVLDQRKRKSDEPRNGRSEQSNHHHQPQEQQ